MPRSRSKRRSKSRRSRSRRKKGAGVSTKRAEKRWSEEAAWHNGLRAMFERRPFAYEKKTMNVYTANSRRGRIVYFQSGYPIPMYSKWGEYRKGYKLGERIRKGRIKSVKTAISKYKRLVGSTRSNRSAYLADLTLCGFWEGLTTRNNDCLGRTSWKLVRESIKSFNAPSMIKNLKDWFPFHVR